MAQTTYDISADQGADYSVVFTYRDSSNALVNLTGCSSRMQVRKFAESEYPFISLTNGSGMTLGGAAGTISVSIPAASLSVVPAGSYKYDIEIAFAGGLVVKLISGNFVLNKEITR